MICEVPRYNSLDPREIHKNLVEYHHRLFTPEADEPTHYRDSRELESALAAMKNIKNLYPHLDPVPEPTNSKQPVEQDFIEAEQWLEKAFDPHLKIKDRQTNEVCWNGEAEEFIGSRWAVLMSGGKLSRSQLSTLLRMPGNTIHWMRTTGKCRVHTRDLAEFLKMYDRQYGFAKKPFAERAKDTQQMIRQEKQRTKRDYSRHLGTPYSIQDRNK